MESVLGEDPVSAAQEASSSEGRIERRQRTILGGEILFEDGSGSLDCRIRNMSKSGARLDLLNTADVPDRFILAINNGKDRLPVRLAWRSVTSVGVEFEVVDD